MSITNEGWASHVVCKWMELATQTLDKDEHKTSKFCMFKFFKYTYIITKQKGVKQS